MLKSQLIVTLRFPQHKISNSSQIRIWSLQQTGGQPLMRFAKNGNLIVVSVPKESLECFDFVADLLEALDLPANRTVTPAIVGWKFVIVSVLGAIGICERN